MEVDKPGPGQAGEENDATRDEGAVPAGRGRDRGRDYALRHEKGAYWPWFLPLVSFQLTPRASTWLFNAWARE